MSRGGLAIVGGGLAGGLLAYRLARTRPDVALQLFESGPRLGGTHTWSFHTTDVSPEQRAWLAPFVTRSWESYEVRFPGMDRRIEGGYHSISSERFHQVVAAALGERVRLGVAADALGPDGLTFEGRRIEAACVVDARGFPALGRRVLGHQKFLGRHLRLAAPHRLSGPVLMDATVEQVDGYRFVYVLPWGERSVLVEDTRYSDSGSMDDASLRGEIEGYVTRQGWRVDLVLGEERGVLPIPLGGSLEDFAGSSPDVPRAGVRAGLFHPTTGYSLPDAVRLADAIAAMPALESRALAGWIDAYARERWRRGSFLRFLNRMLFRAAEPTGRYRVLQRFYRLPEATIHRFYAGALTNLDRARLLVGRPPVPLGRAARCLFGAEIPA
jgi:lycopene beta-cyclase